MKYFISYWYEDILDWGMDSEHTMSGFDNCIMPFPQKGRMFDLNFVQKIIASGRSKEETMCYNVKILNFIEVDE